MSDLKDNNESELNKNDSLLNMFLPTSKVCPMCKVEKDSSEYGKYFSHKRQKHRLQSYCKSCLIVDSRKRSSMYYKKNKEYRVEYERNYRADPNNKIKLREVSRKFKMKYVSELKDCYVREQLKKYNNIPTNVSREMPEIVEAKRLEIKIKRKIKSLKNDTK